MDRGHSYALGALGRVAARALAVFFLALTAAVAAWGQGGEKLAVYASLTATTAQLPLQGALKAGWPPGGSVAMEYWKNLDDLRALTLSGQGDVWVGHLEGFARASARGAPISLAAVTVWRKFFFVSYPLPLDPGGPERHPVDPGELLAYVAANGGEISTAPRNSPVTALLEGLAPPGTLKAVSLPAQQLALELLTGKLRLALLPEPFSSAVILKNPSIKIVGSLEQEHARLHGGEGLMPQAGVAVNSALAKRDPALVLGLVEAMKKCVADLSGRPIAEAAALLPDEVREGVGEEILLESLRREPIMVRGASEARQEIFDFLRLAAPELFSPGAAGPSSDFLFDPS